MARPKGKAGAQDKAPEQAPFKTQGVRMTVAYAEWLARAAKFDRMSIAAFFDKAVADRAKMIGFPEPPPERLP